MVRDGWWQVSGAARRNEKEEYGSSLDLASLFLISFPLVCVLINSCVYSSFIHLSVDCILAVPASGDIAVQNRSS